MRKTKGTMTRVKNNHNREISLRFRHCCNIISFFLVVSLIPILKYLPGYFLDKHSTLNSHNLGLPRYFPPFISFISCSFFSYYYKESRHSDSDYINLTTTQPRVRYQVIFTRRNTTGLLNHGNCMCVCVCGPLVNTSSQYYIDIPISSGLFEQFTVWCSYKYI